MQNKQAFVSGLIVTAGLVFSMSAALPVRAQMVSNLVYYPTTATNAGPCTVQRGSTLATQRVVTYAKPYWRERVQREEVHVFGSLNCSADSLLYTITADVTANGTTRNVIPTALGMTALAKQCNSTPWQADTPSPITEPLYNALRDTDEKQTCSQMQAQGTTGDLSP